MDWKVVRSEALVFLKWVLLAVVAGLAVGVLGGVFALGLNRVTELREKFDWLLYLLPLGGLAIVGMYHGAGLPGGGSTNSVFTAVQEDAPLPLRTAPLIFVSTLTTHLLGGSAGREGAALQLGGAVSAALGRLVRLDSQDVREMTMCGMAAAFSAMFGTPLAAAVFALEVVSVGRMFYAALVPCVLSALVGVWVSGQMGVAPTAFTLTASAELSPVSLLQVCALGALFALLSAVFCMLLHQVGKLCERFLGNCLLRAAVGGALVAALTLLCGVRDYNGAGGAVIARAMTGEAVPWAFLLKMLFTALTLGAGFKGGEIVPALFTGSTFGCVAAPLLGLPAPLGAALGMVSVFCGVTNCPMTSILLAIELFGGQSVPLFALSCAVAYMLSGYFGLYSEQKLLYSKFRMEFIDRKAH